MNYSTIFLNHTTDPNLVILKCECGLAPGCTSEIPGFNPEADNEGLRALVAELENIFTPSTVQANALPNDHEWCGRYLRLPLEMIPAIDWLVEVAISVRCPILDIEPSLPTTVGDDFCIASKKATYKVRSKNSLYMLKRTYAPEAATLL